MSCLPFHFRFLAVAFAAALLLAPPVLAQDGEGDAAADAPTATLQPIAESTAARLEGWAEQVERDREVIAELRQQLKTAEGLRREVIATRIEKSWTELLDVALDYVETVADEREKGSDVSEFQPRALEFLDGIPDAAREALNELDRRIELRGFSKPVAEQAPIDQQFFELVRSGIDTRRALYRAVQLEERFSIDTTEERDFLVSELTEFAEGASVFLDLALAERDGLQAALSAVGDDAELSARLRLAQTRVSRTAALIEANIVLMKKLDLPTTQYEKQLLKSTGSISTGALRLQVLTGLVADFLDQTQKVVVEQGPKIVFKALLFLLILFVFRKLGQLVRAGIARGISNSRVNLSVLLREMILSISSNLVFLLGVLIALSQIGISLGPVLAGLGIVGFIIGFALQDSLSNFASGMLILIYRPFDVGDTIETSGVRGKVNRMTLVNTTILTFDNQSLIIPNNKIWQDVIKNVTAQRSLRVDMEIGVAYDSDIDKVEQVLLDLLKADDRVLDEPAAVVKVGSFGDSAINILCRPWVNTEDYWDVLWDMNRKIKRAFEENGIVIPFPQRDVHHFNQS